MFIVQAFKWLTGRLRKEREWEQQPRIVLPDRELMQPGDPRWVMSQEYIDPKKPRFKFYAAAKQVGKSSWAILSVMSDLDASTHTVSDVQTLFSESAKSPRDVVDNLRTAESIYQTKGYKPLPQSPATWPEFANASGFHFDRDMNMFQMSKKSAITRETMMDRSALEKVFNHQADTPKKGLGTWEGLRERIIDQPLREKRMTLQDCANADLNRNVVNWLAEYNDLLQKLDANLLSGSSTPKSMLNDYESRAEGIDWVFRKAGDDAEPWRALTRASLLLTVLHTGNRIYAEQFSSGDAKIVQAIADTGEFLQRFAVDKVGIRGDHAKKMLDLLISAPDPQGTETPLDQILNGIAQANPSFLKFWIKRNAP